MTDYPEHDKLSAIRDRSQEVGEFLEWLRGTRGLHICEYDDASGQLYLARPRTTDLLSEYFGIDQGRLEVEKTAMLDQIRRRVLGGGDRD